MINYQAMKICQKKDLVHLIAIGILGLISLFLK